ncbi:MAG: 2-oxo acid dehydrogenase subunit E2 [Myxococcota bacterium]|jgi:hypothetical protein|nr:2-oxo acid dehydrogenase subunit E2 [Myxococcota bacterium]
MLIAIIVAASLFLIWVLMNFKTSRPDGTLIKRVHPYRVMLGHILPKRNDACVYFDVYARADKLLEYIAEAKKRFHVDVTYCLVAACGVGLAASPRMNRFVAGRRLYQRNDRVVTFSAKRQRLNRKAKLTALKTVFREGESFEALCTRIKAELTEERSDKTTSTDKEMNLLTRIPRAVLVRAVRLAMWLDYHNLLPAWFIKGEGMYASIFVANLGSLGMDAGFHHLYDWGNCPLFMMVGKIEDRPVVEDGQVVVRKMMHIRWTYDERIDDALNSKYGMDSVTRVLEDPFRYLGCLAEDGSDAYALDERGQSMREEADQEGQA